MTATAAVVVLLLHPVLEDAGPLRLVAAGVGDGEVAWNVDGVEVARTGDREAAVLDLAAGPHEVRATGPASRAWDALARPDGPAAGATYVPAWSASHEPAPQVRQGGAGVPPLPLALALAAAVLLLWPNGRGRRGLGRNRARLRMGRRAQGP